MTGPIGSEPRLPREIAERLRDIRLHWDTLGVISARRCDHLIELNRTRNDLQHDYPLVRADRLFDAIAVLRSEFGPFVRDYARWLHRR